MQRELTSEQQELVAIYKKKWFEIGISTNNIDLHKATKSIQEIYKLLGYSQPEILLYDSPEAIAIDIQSLLETRITNIDRVTKEPLFKRIGNSLGKPLSYLIQGLFREIFIEIGISYLPLCRIHNNLDLFEFRGSGNYLSQMYSVAYNRLPLMIKQKLDFKTYQLQYISEDKLKEKLQSKFADNVVSIPFYTNNCLFIEYCCEVLSKECNLLVWQALKDFIINCGFIVIPFQALCLVCDRPKRIFLDNNKNSINTVSLTKIEYRDSFKQLSFGQTNN